MPIYIEGVNITGTRIENKPWRLLGKIIQKGVSLCAMCRSARNFAQDVCGHFHPCGSAQPNPTPGLTPTPDLTLTPILWGARDRQGQSGAIFPKKLRAAERPTSTSKTRTLRNFLPASPAHGASLPNASIFSSGDNVRNKGTPFFCRFERFLKILRGILNEGYIKFTGTGVLTGTQVLEPAEYPGFWQAAGFKPKPNPSRVLPGRVVPAWYPGFDHPGFTSTP